MDLRQMSYLVAIADEGGIRAASRRLHVAQPQISQAVKRLEAELGVELLHRSSRGALLTPEGTELAAHARDILGRVAAATAAVQAPARGLRVGVLAGALAAGELLAPILQAWHTARPDVVLHLEDLTFVDQIPSLLSGALDAAIVRLPLDHPDLVLTPIATEPRVVMVGVQHALAGAEEVPLAEAIRHPTLPLDAPPEWAAYWQLDPERGASLLAPDVPPVRTVPDSQLMLATHDVLISSPANIGRLAPHPLVRSIHLVGASPNVIAVARRRQDRRGTLLEFVEAARESAARSIAALPGGGLPG